MVVQPPVKLYVGQVTYEVEQQGRQWLMRFLVSKDLNALLEVNTNLVNVSNLCIIIVHKSIILHSQNR